MKMRATVVLIVLTVFSMILSPPVSATWIENGNPVTTHADYQFEPEMVTDGAGGTIVCWTDWRTALYYDIYAQRLDAAGNPVWGPSDVPICTSSLDQVNPVIISDGEGGAIIAWQDTRSSNDNIYAQRINAAGHIQWSVNGVAICTDGEDQTGPQIISDGSGGAIIAWVDRRSGTDSDIYAQRIDGGGVVQWIANGSFVIWLSGDQHAHSMVPDGSGGAVISWADTRSGTKHIYAQRIDEMGFTQWSSMGAPICTANGDCSEIVSIPDGNGGAIIAWQDLRNVYSDIYAQHLLFNSSVQWTTDGEPVIMADNSQIDPSIVSDGAGGLIAGWTDYRTGMYPDIYLQRLDSGGNRLWNTDGVPICTYVGSQHEPILAEDGKGGAFVSWIDYRNNVDPDIYGQRVDASGTAQWIPGGTGICVLEERQGHVRMIAHDDGGALITWDDDRGTGYDIYANYVDSQGRAGYLPAVIHSIEDIPGDQGGVVNLAWNASAYDHTGHEITHYSIWRALDTPAAQMMMAEGAMLLEEMLEVPVSSDVPVLRLSPLGAQTYYWELIGNIDAYYLEGYSMTAPTAYDSTGLGHSYQYFQVIAHSASASVFYVSDPDSGYSVDNLAPDAPLGLAGEQQYTPEGIQLTWDDNVEPDLLEYRIYRGTSSGFVPGSGNMISSLSGSEYFDDSWSWELGFFYKVSAIDIHGNESGYTLLEPDQLTGDDPLEIPAATFLAQNFPNPFNPVTTIGFGLMESGNVSLRIYDATGRLVTTLVDESRPAGSYTTGWNGRNTDGAPVSSGVYFYRLITKGFEETKKMILLR